MREDNKLFGKDKYQHMISDDHRLSGIMIQNLYIRKDIGATTICLLISISATLGVSLIVYLPMYLS